jgi:cytochrome c oxidase assembly factor CtaG
MFDLVAGAGVIGFALFILASIFWVWMLIDCLQNSRLQGVEKLVWIVVILFLHLLGAVIYFFVGREQRL